MKKACPAEVCLAIGDGANDAPMIYEAHVGIGIYGKECKQFNHQTMQLVNSPLNEFQYLWNLLMVHGRLCYLRILNSFFISSTRT
jgi:P-type E1-E2 ATPase